MTGPTETSSSRTRYTNEEIAFIFHHLGPSRKVEEVTHLYNQHFSQSRSKEGLTQLIHRVRDPRHLRKDDHDEQHYLTLAKTYAWYTDVVSQPQSTGFHTLKIDQPADSKPQTKPPKPRVLSEGNDPTWTAGGYRHTWTDEQRAFVLTYHRRIPKLEDLLDRFNAQFADHVDTGRLKVCIGYVQRDEGRMNRLLELAPNYPWYQPLPSPSHPERAKMDRVERRRVVSLEYQKSRKEKREAWKRGALDELWDS